jgi:DNA primase
MMGRIPDSQVDEILNRLDIVDVISGHMNLRKAGQNFKGLCPFHHEKTPSFVVSPDKQIWHCFGCGVGGNAFGFLMRIDNMEFPEAVRQCAEKVGIRIEEDTSRDAQSGRWEASFQTNDRVAIFFHRCLNETPDGQQTASEYFRKRGVRDETRDLFRLGWAPKSRQGLFQWSKRNGLNQDLLIHLGLLTKTQSGSVADHFHGRVVFPIADPRGRVLGFGARVLGETLPKYINSTESELFHKRKTLYGLNVTQPVIRKVRQLILVEGYMDLIMLYQHGIQNVAATLGTALTEDHVRYMKRIAEECVLVFDADAAGQEATLRGAEILLNYDLGIKILRLPQTKDPDDLVRAHGADHFRDLVRRAEDLFDFRLRVARKQYPERDARSQWKIVSLMLPILSRISNAVIQAGYVKKLSDMLGLPEESIRVELSKSQRPSWREKKIVSQPATVSRAAREFSEERMLLGLMLDDEEIISFVREISGSDEFQNPEYRAVAELVYGEHEKGRSCQVSHLLGKTHAPEQHALLTHLVTDVKVFEDKWQVMEDCIRRMKEKSRSRKLDAIKSRIRVAESERDDSLRRKLLEEFQNIQKSKVVVRM